MPHPTRALPLSSRRAWRGAAGTLLLLAIVSIESCATRAHRSGSARDAADAGAMAMSSPSAASVSADHPEAPPPASPASAAPSFEASVRPVLLSRCAPCHEPGGKMYARLPFDNAEVVGTNAEGISRRLKGDDLAALKKWAATLPSRPAAHP